MLTEQKLNAAQELMLPQEAVVVQHVKMVVIMNQQALHHVLLALQGINVLMVLEHNAQQELMLQQEAVVVQIVLQDSIHLQMVQVVAMLVGLEAIKVQPVKQLVTLVGLEHIQMREQQVVQVVQIGMLNVQLVIKMVVQGVQQITKYQEQVVCLMYVLPDNIGPALHVQRAKKVIDVLMEKQDICVMVGDNIKIQQGKQLARAVAPESILIGVMKQIIGIILVTAS